jgi:hypothetical protein
MNFDKAHKLSQQANEYNDCTVKAIAITCDVPYKVAHKALANEGRKSRCGSYWSQQVRAINSLGYALETVGHTAKTINQVKSDRVVQNGYFLAYVRGHVAAVVNGKVEDWTDGRRHRIQKVFKVTPTATRRERKQMMKELF